MPADLHSWFAVQCVDEPPFMGRMILRPELANSGSPAGAGSTTGMIRTWCLLQRSGFPGSGEVSLHFQNPRTVKRNQLLGTLRGLTAVFCLFRRAGTFHNICTPFSYLVFSRTQIACQRLHCLHHVIHRLVHPLTIGNAPWSSLLLELVLNLGFESSQALGVCFKLGTLLFFHVFDDFGVNLLQEFIGLSQYLFKV